MDVIDSDAQRSGPRERWGRWSHRRRVAAGAGLVLFTAVVLPVAVDRTRAWEDERSSRDRIALAAELGVDASSTAWTPSGRGRLDYSLALRNLSPRALRVTKVHGQHEGLRLDGRPLSAAPVPPGTVVHVPLSVQLDCRRRAAGATSAVVHISVSVVAASGRSADLTSVVRGSEPLTGVARMLCANDPALRIPQLSGPVSSVAVASLAGPPASPTRPPPTRQPFQV